MNQRDLQLRSKKVAENLSESIHILDHDPSMALYRLQEHINKTLGVLVHRKHQMANLNNNLQGACFDLDNAIQAVDDMSTTIPTFENVYEKLRHCMYYKQQIDCEVKRAASKIRLTDNESQQDSSGGVPQRDDPQPLSTSVVESSLPRSVFGRVETGPQLTSVRNATSSGEIEAPSSQQKDTPPPQPSSTAPPAARSSAFSLAAMLGGGGGK